MDTLRQDLTYALRTLRRNPGFASVVILTLGLGIGANAAIFTILDQVLLRQLPVQKPDELVMLDGPGPFSGRTHNDHTFSYPMYQDIRDRNQVMSGVLARFPASITLTYKGQAERADSEAVSGNYFDVLGVRPALGRLLSPDDDRAPGGHPVVVLTHGFWQRRFSRDTSILNQTLHVNGTPMTVVGVAPRGFVGTDVVSAPDVFVPLMMKGQITPTWNDLDNRRSRWLNILGRLKPGTSRDQATASLNVLYRQILVDDVKLMPATASASFRERFVAKKLGVLPARTGHSYFREDLSTPLVVLMSMVGLVLLIACANVANLLLARSAFRQKEIAVRMALGAGRRRIVGQLLVESLVLAFLGGLAGLVIALWTSDLLVRALPFDSAARALSTGPDLRVVAFTFAVALATGVFFGLVPAWQVSRPALTATLRNESTTVTAGHTRARLRKGLVIAQVAFSLLLLIGAGLFTRSLANLRNLDPGFQADQLLTFSVDPSLNGYGQEHIRALVQQLQERLAQLPQVSQASLAELPAMADSVNRSTIKLPGYTPQEGEDMSPNVNKLGPGYFATMGMPLLSGREFTAADGASAPRVAVINETMARKHFAGKNPIGERFGFSRNNDPLAIEIVGVVKDAKYSSLRDEIPRFVYVPFAQGEQLGDATFYLRASGDAIALADVARGVVRQMDANLPVFSVKTMRAQVEESLFTERAVATLSAGFGILATLLAAVGLYGVMAYTVSQRTREFGIRVALGAERRRILWLVLREVAILAAIGIAVGLPGAWGLARLVQSELYGLSPADPLTLAGSVLLLASAAALAGFVPARRATRVEPMVALRYE
jgi:predicted permease